MAVALGSSGALTLAAGAVVASAAVMLSIPAVWTIRPLTEDRSVTTPVG